MVVLSFLFPLFLLLVSSPSGAAPVADTRAAAKTVTVSTPFGPAAGVADSPTVGRFAVRYATAARWKDSVMVTKWQFPNNQNDASGLPLACPQPSSTENSADTSEDCLSMIIFVPAIAATTKVPAMMWIHGGSFIIGSATGPGLDGSALAEATGSIVAVMQYRLGAFGFLSPSGESNLAVKDSVNALNFLQKVLPSFNGDTSKVTIAGQSSGATMVRALLATPSASSLFKTAVLHSDPMNYGFLSAGAFQTINNFLITQLSCNKDDSSCLNKLSMDDVLDASLTVFGVADSLDASAGAFMPMRPVMDRSLITSPLDSTAPFPKQSKTIIVSTVQNEAGPAIFTQNPSFVSESDYANLVNQSLGSSRTATILASNLYSVPPSFASNTDTFDARIQLQSLGTDQIWRCPSWTFARNWAAAGGKVYVGEYVIGATYPDNEDISFCTSGSAVCHEDDIKIAFGAVSSPSTAQSNLVKEIQTRYKAFFSSGSPNTNGFASWPTGSNSATNAILLGASGTATIGACETSFWGDAVLYDYQLFGA